MQIAVLAPFKGVSYFQAMALERLASIEGVQLNFIYHPSFPNIPGTRAPARRSLYKWWRHTVQDSQLEHRLSISDVLPGAHPLPLEMELLAPYSAHLSSEGASLLKLLELDVILNLDTHILRGEILHIPKHGVWSFHHGNPQEFRGSPPGFWEIYSGAKESGAILQRLGERLDDGQVLRKASLPTVFHSYTEQRNALFGVSVSWPAEVAYDLLQGKPLPSTASPPSKAVITRRPNNWQTLTFWSKLLKAQVRHHIGL